MTYCYWLNKTIFFYGVFQLFERLPVKFSSRLKPVSYYLIYRNLCKWIYYQLIG